MECWPQLKVIEKYMTGGIGCFDKEGLPVRFERFGYLDVKGMFYSSKKVDLEMKKLYDQEVALKVMRQQSEKLGKKIDRLTVILDLDQIGSKQLWRPGLALYLHLIKLLEDNYPEFVKRLIVINAPKIFPIFFKICRPLISDDMNKKMRVYGTNFLPEVLKIIDEEELPAFLGGKQVGPDNDIYCTHRIKAGGLVPESYYLKDVIDTTEFESTTISAGCKLVLKVPIEQPNCVIRWEFLTEGKDISFGVSLIPKGSEKQQVVVPASRVQCHMVPEYGSLTCEQLGTYVILFDNSYSWTKGKKLKYNIEALIEDEELLEEVEQIMNQKIE
ncbi:SEC14L2 [Bugula neritina]|uniref:SEC14L2 n=1 Tax=Bugula neritina TaxID=10212 RepID=A0A7J7JV92_BUGNE|nr:SEC14L2 [Bugula neritina]